MKKNSERGTAAGLILGLAVAAGVASQLTGPQEVAALAAGYGLFALNFWALKSISRMLVQAAAHGHSSGRARLWLTLGSLAKFLGLIGALFVLLVTLQLSGLYVALGSLLSLILLTAMNGLSYLRGLSEGPKARSGS